MKVLYHRIRELISGLLKEEPDVIFNRTFDVTNYGFFPILSPERDSWQYKFTLYSFLSYFHELIGPIPGRIIFQKIEDGSNNTFLGLLMMLKDSRTPGAS